MSQPQFTFTFSSVTASSRQTHSSQLTEEEGNKENACLAQGMDKKMLLAENNSHSKLTANLWLQNTEKSTGYEQGHLSIIVQSSIFFIANDIKYDNWLHMFL